MAGKQLLGLLESLNLLSTEAVFFSDEKNGLTFHSLSPDIQKRLEAIEPDAFFIFNNQPYILFFDLTENQNIDREQKIHRQVWSFDYSPIIFIVKDNEIQLYNAFNYDKKLEQLQKINIADEERNHVFSFWNLQSGESWKWLQANYYKSTIHKKRVNQRLFDNIKEVREKLTDAQINGNNFLTEDHANILILRLIFIRYLIDRGVMISEDYIQGTSVLEKRQSFSVLINDPAKLDSFFGFLNEKFNGVLFKDTDITLSTLQAYSLSLIFDGRQNKVQPTLFDNLLEFYFDVFDFSIIPVEIISGIYESLINEETKDEHSAVYTPSFLVEYILNETVDKHLLNNASSECKVFDPSCGSGIFIVQSYRRMADKELALNGGKVNKTKLREIAQNNLFGVDLNEQALKVTCFSIYIAILDYHDPKTIMDNFKFPKLINENLFSADFFDTNHPFNEIVKSKKQDFILGNPPWKSNKGDKHLAWLQTNQKKTGRFEIAQSFLLRSKDFMYEHTVSALIVTSTIFYNISETTKAFKKEFLTTFCLDRFFDLSPVRRLIFEEKDSPAAIVYYRLGKEESHLNNIVKHTSIKSNIFLKYFKTLIIEKFDQKQIQQKHFLENDWMFKVALYGNTLDFTFLKRLQKASKNINDLIDNKSLFAGAGIKSNKGDDYAEALIGLPLIENKEIKEYYTPVDPKRNQLKKEEVYFESGRKKDLFFGKKILIKEQARNESELVISYVDKDCVYKNGIWGITSVDEVALKGLIGYLISDFYTYYIYITACSWGVSTRPQIRLHDEYLSFPFVELPSHFKDKFAKLIDQFIKPFEAYYAGILRSPKLPVPEDILDEINKIINATYQIRGYEKDLIDYVLNVSRYQFQESKQYKFTRKIDQNSSYLKEYISVFTKEFAQLYEGENLQVEVYSLDHFIALNFVFTKGITDGHTVYVKVESDIKEVLKRIANSLSISKLINAHDPTKNLFIQKDIKGFEENSFYIIKPNEYKCWHKAIAWYDVAEIKETIEQAELSYLTKHNNA